MRKTIFVAIAGLFAACSTPDTISFAAPDPAATIEEIYVVTQQNVALGRDAFRSDRSTVARRARLSVSIPPSHELGQIAWPDGPTDPLTDFAVVDFTLLDDDVALERAIAAAEGDTVFLFVHGYNTTSSEALYRFAQIAHDFDLPDTRLMFSWASAGVPGAYVYDRDSVLFARDDLVALLTDIARKTDKTINVMAHSMGAMLTMEAMRQLAISDNRDVLRRIESTTFLSPDLDPDIFRAQANAVGELPQPFVILHSQTDRALRLSSLLSGGRERVGGISSAADVDGMNVTFIDITNLRDGSSLDHMVAFTSPVAITVLRQMIEQDALRETELTQFLVLNSDGSILAN
ncbi:alpha/beta fold hydrolase [Cognatiyoonia sp. IB215446]|uniref:alpha/beta hydrolase n=1 Tax=Cognatiyoonia sp. IB215446 TaxID=3097355 RepID=UPI002A161D9A|nr:alpha/beta hydrolase [Cognatiyoonia sp. IB215446]MDX8347728.1 alpha/beta fold hydrolase [Cognatiyoonia sp. IB215446]